MTNRSLRHWKPRFKTAALSLIVPFIGYLAGRCFLACWEWADRAELWPSIVALAAGIGMSLLALLIATEISIAYRRWIAAQKKEDELRCVLPHCDAVLRRPFAFEPGLGRLCMDCLRRINWADGADELPAIARKAGA
jgi:hypothetical protein